MRMRVYACLFFCVIASVSMHMCAVCVHIRTTPPHHCTCIGICMHERSCVCMRECAKRQCSFYLVATTHTWQGKPHHCPVNSRMCRTLTPRVTAFAVSVYTTSSSFAPSRGIVTRICTHFRHYVLVWVCVRACVRDVFVLVHICLFGRSCMLMCIDVRVLRVCFTRIRCRVGTGVPTLVPTSVPSSFHSNEDIAIGDES